MTDTAVARAALLDTATLSDALDRHGLNGQCYRIRPCASTCRMAGRAWTLLYGPAGSPAGTVGDYIDDVAPGSVIVLDNGGRDNATVWGDILTEVANARGIAGTVIDGNESIEQVGARLFDHVIACASGDVLAKAEEHKHREFQFWAEQSVSL